MTLLFASRVPDWSSHSFKYVIALILYTAATRLSDKVQHNFLRVVLRTVCITMLCNFLFESSHSLQHIIVPGWMDAQVIAFETQFTGIESTLYFQQHMSTLLTEIMMFAYVIYVPLLPFISLFAFWERSPGVVRLPLQSCLCILRVLHWIHALSCCRVLSITKKNSTPYPLMVMRLRGLVSGCDTMCTMREGSLPSPHCAAATVMLVMMWRYNCRVFWPLLPVVLVLYVSTVYGRYHYISDGIVGIIAGVAVLMTAPALSRTLQKLAMRFYPQYFRDTSRCGQVGVLCSVLCWCILTR